MSTESPAPAVAYSGGDQPPTSGDRPLTPAPLVAGVLATCWLLTTTRWGSHIGWHGLYLTDLLIASAMVALVVRGARSARAGQPLLLPWDRVVLLLAFLAWVSLRLTASWPWSGATVRDVAPYLYAVTGLVAAWGYRLTDEAGRRRTALWLLVALHLHIAWWATSVLFPGLPVTPQIADGVRVFTVRADVDTALAGVYAGWLLLGILRRKPHLVLRVVAFLGVWALILRSTSRAGVIAAAVVAVVAAIMALPPRTTRLTWRHWTAVAAVAAIAVGALALSPIADRALGTFGFETSSESATYARGTTNARSNSWTSLVHYVSGDPVRAVVGVGFGPDFMTDSNAEYFLLAVQPDTTRSPHNYWLGSLARLGLVGLALLVVMAAAVTRRILVYARGPAADELLTLTGLLTVALIIPATLGVVLESPFGAVPFWWCVGLVAAATPGSDRRVLREGRGTVLVALLLVVAVLLGFRLRAEADPGMAFPEPAAGPALSQLDADITTALSATEWPAGITASGTSGDSGVPADVAWCGSQPVNELRCSWGPATAPRTAVLMGGTSALDYLPALQRALVDRGGWRLVSTAGYDCAFGDYTLAGPETTADLPDGCTDRAADSMALVNRLRPDLVIISGLADNDVQTRLGYRMATQELALMTVGLEPTEWWLPGPPPVTPPAACGMGEGPGACVTHAPTDWMPAEAIMAGWRGQAVVDPTPWFCHEADCPPFVGRTATRSGEGRLTAPYAWRLGPVVGEFLATLDLPSD